MPVDVVGHMHGEQDYGDLRMGFGDLMGRVEAVHDGHGDVHNDHVRLKLLCFFHSLLPVAGFRANYPAGLKLQQITNSHAHDFVVVRDQNSYPGMGRTVTTHCDYARLSWSDS